MWLINTDFDAANGYGAKMSPRNHCVPLAESQHHVINSTNPGGALDDSVEDRLHVRGRAADDAEHLGRCRLVLQRLAQFRVALLEFPEEAHVLDGDDCLIREGFKESDLLFGEWANLHTTNLNHTQRSTLAQQRRGKYGASAEALLVNLRNGKLGSLRRQVTNMNRLPVGNGSTRNDSARDGYPLMSGDHCH